MYRTVTSPWQDHMMAFYRARLQVAAIVCVILLIFYFIIFHYCPGTFSKEFPASPKPRLQPFSYRSSHGPCTCPEGSVLLKDHIPEGQYEELVQRRAKELQQHKARHLPLIGSTCSLNTMGKNLVSKDNTGAVILKQTLGAQTVHQNKPQPANQQQVSLNVSKGILTTETPTEGVTIEGHGKTALIMESSSLEDLNNLLAKVHYTSTVYHINTGDLASFQFENLEAIFPIAIKQPHVPVLYDMGKDINSHVTITTKTFLRYAQLRVLLNSIRQYYSNMEVIIADDNLKPEPVTGEHIRQYIMPPAQGWFAGRNLAISQVMTKYFLWVDDDFVFTAKTKIEKLVEVMEAVPELDVLGGSVQGNQFQFSLFYEEGEETDGGCLSRKSLGKFHSLPGYPQCFLASGVVNFFLARTDAVQRFGFDPKLTRVAHSEFFMDGLGSLLVATCGHVSIGHQPRSTKNKDAARYYRYREQTKKDEEYKLQLHFFKNNLRCIHYG